MLGLLLFLFFVVLPIVEVILLVWIGRQIGFWYTLGLVVATGVLGGLLARWQGWSAWRDISEAWRSGRVPGAELAAGALFLVGAAFLITPGVITDAIGLLLMVPVLRRAGGRLVVRLLGRRFRGRHEGEVVKVRLVDPPG